MGVIGIKSKADRVSVPVILESLHIQRNSVTSRRRTVEKGQIAQVLDNLNQKGAGAASWFADLYVLRPQAQG
jgi:N-acetylglucosamine-6-phosphate deacetylase